MNTDINEIQKKTTDLIDRLKNITFTYGLGGGGNEYTVLVEIFLYKFLNDKFIFEAKKVLPKLAQADDFWKQLYSLTTDEYEEMCDLMGASIELHKEHLIPFVASQQNEPNFADFFDATLRDIARTNQSVFYIQNEDKTKIEILRPISELISGGNDKRNEFCKALIGAVSGFSFEGAFDAGYDFFSTIFEYLIKDYNANGGGTYAEYYTPHFIAMIMAHLLVNPDEDIKNVSVYDPSAGTGTLVIALAHCIGVNRCSIYTQDISDKSSTMMMLNLILNGLTHSLSQVIQGNTLSSPAHKNSDGSLKTFDYIISNPPFKLDFSDFHGKLKNDTFRKIEHSGNVSRFFAGVPNITPKDKTKMEIYLCFFQHLLFSLNDHGKAAIVVPTGFLESKGIGAKIRKYLVNNNYLRGVVSMPSNVFANTGTNVSVIFIDKNRSDHDNVVLIDASNLGETIKEGKNQKTKLNDEDVNLIIETFRDKNAIDGFSVVVTPKEIADKSYSFIAGQYSTIKIEYVDITAEVFNSRMVDFKTTLAAQLEESKRLGDEIMKQFDTLTFNE